MAWFTTSGAAPDVVVGKSETVTTLYVLSTGYTQVTSNTQTEKRGMDYATASAYLTTQATAGKNPRLVPIGAGGYNVISSETTVSDWSLIT